MIVVASIELLIVRVFFLKHNLTLVLAKFNFTQFISFLFFFLSTYFLFLHPRTNSSTPLNTRQHLNRHCENTDLLTVTSYHQGKPVDLGVYCGRRRPPMLMSIETSITITYVTRSFGRLNDLEKSSEPYGVRVGENQKFLKKMKRKNVYERKGFKIHFNFVKGK